jgi:DNA polymerase (family 10)
VAAARNTNTAAEGERGRLKPMKNSEITMVFQDIADLLELKGKNPFKIRAYQKAVRSIEQLTVEVEQLLADDKLKEIPGVGEAITKKLSELVTTGHLDYYEKLKAEFPERKL